MKFAASVLVVLAIAVTANAATSLGFYGYNGYPYPYGYAAAPYFATPGAAAYAAYTAFNPAAFTAAGTPFSGNYLAANRGTVHVAPLEGHTQSVLTYNTDPAPGTF